LKIIHYLYDNKVKLLTIEYFQIELIIFE